MMKYISTILVFF